MAPRNRLTANTVAEERCRASRLEGSSRSHPYSRMLERPSRPLRGASGRGRRGHIAGGSSCLFEEAAELVDVVLGHNGDGNIDARVDLLAFLDLEHGFDAGHAFLERI